ncbi:MAG: hypothetical protein SOX56_07285 [[Pasteurella] mairii]|uniref:Uncharacterized protein n=1 Tax=[Pasteurella] mairii TaxID=757 RepID=A0A379B4C3_9PAST|nr:hypothetical protein [[Pasteurella] mairii]SUB33312.1 Uncharacterised protein [[Pasteurella] mairii]
MKKFLDVITKFTQTKSDDERSVLFSLLPEDILAHKKFYDEEMFINSSRHTFYILTSLFIDWINQLDEQYPKQRHFLYELQDLFEYIDDDISIDEQSEVIEKTKVILKQYQ